MKKSIITTLLFALLLGGSLYSNAQCKADFQYFASCNTVQFYDSSFTSGVTNTYSWNFGNGMNGYTQNPTITYSKTGTYKVTLIVTALDSARKVVCADTVQKTIVISSKCCKANFSYQISGLDVYFYNYSTPGSTATWDFGDSTSTGLSPHTYKKAGTYTVCLKITDSSGTCSDSICKTITVKSSSCNASFTWSQPDSTKNEIVFTNTSTPSSGLFHSWNFGDQSGSSSKSPKHTYTTGGTYRVCLSIYDSTRSCTKTICKTITVKGKSCKAAFNYTNAGNNIVYFGNTGSRGGQYSWSFGDGRSSTDFNPKHQYSKPGKYTVCLTVTDSANSCTDSVCQTIMVDSVSCDATFTYTLDTTNNKVTFAPTSTDTSLSHSWWAGNYNLGGSATSFTHTFKKGGTITACHYVENRSRNSFCSDTFCVTFTLPVDSSCDASFTVQYPDSSKPIAQFYAKGGGKYVKYAWDFGDSSTSTQRNPKHTYAGSGTYRVYLKVTVCDSNNNVLCVDSSVQYVRFFIQPPACRALFKAIADSTTNFKILIINQSKGTNLSYYWDFGDSTTATGKNPKHTYKKSGKYLLCLTVTDRNCTSTYCDTIGMDSTGKMLKREGFDIEVIDEGTNSAGKVEISSASAFPNPFTNKLSLRLDNSKGVLEHIEIVDLKGQLIPIQTIKTSSSSVEINTSHIPAGMYLIRFTQDDVLQTKRIVKVE